MGFGVDCWISWFGCWFWDGFDGCFVGFWGCVVLVGLVVWLDSRFLLLSWHRVCGGLLDFWFFGDCGFDCEFGWFCVWFRFELVLWIWMVC